MGVIGVNRVEFISPRAIRHYVWRRDALCTAGVEYRFINNVAAGGLV